MAKEIKVYKLWLQIEEIGDADKDEYQNITEPIDFCLTLSVEEAVQRANEILDQHDNATRLHVDGDGNVQEVKR